MNFFLSYYTSFRPSFDGKLIASTQGDAGHQDGRQIKDKEESTRDLLDTMNTNYSEGNFKGKYLLTVKTKQKYIRNEMKTYLTIIW